MEIVNAVDANYDIQFDDTIIRQGITKYVRFLENQNPFLSLDDPVEITLRMRTESNFRSVWAAMPLSYKGGSVLIIGAISYQLGAILVGSGDFPILIRIAVSKVAKYFSKKPTLASENVRDVFTRLDIIPTKPVEGHTHGHSAAARSAANNFAQRYATNLGLYAYFVQMSAADQRKGHYGYRAWFWAKDVHIDPIRDVIDVSQRLNVHIDTDYYVDMSEHLTREFTPTLLYTFIPEDAAAMREDYSFTFNEDQEVVYKVKGGGSYQHQLWDYGSDSLLTTQRFLGIPIATAVYLIEKKRVTTDHFVVLLVPTAKWVGIFALFHWLISGKTLSRLKPVFGEFTRLEVFGREHCVSTSKPGSYASATIPANTDSTILNLADAAKTDLMVSSVESVLSQGPLKEDTPYDAKEHATVLTLFARSRTQTKPPVVYPVENSIRRYQFGNYEQDAKPTLVPFMNPFDPNCYAPDKTKGNEEQAVRTRIEEARTTPRMTQFIDQCMTEFVDRFFPEQGVLSPVDTEEVYERQDRPSQRHILDVAEVSMEPRDPKISTFIKAEPAQKAAAPRIISTYNGNYKREWSKVIYAFAEHLKTMNCYAFGRTPKQIAELVSILCSHAKKVMKTDFSTFDGTINEVMRELERKLLVRGFRIEFRDNILTLHSKGFNLSAFTPHGIKYDTQFARGSGSPETAAFNSVENMFASYVGYRMMKVDNVYYTPDEAYAKVLENLYGGDDGLQGDIDTNAYKKACNLLGLKVKDEQIDRGKLGVEFLSRIYGPEVWYGDTNSCCDIKRQLSKFHTTVVLPPGVEPVHKLFAKSQSYNLSDPNTPIIGPYTKEVLRICTRDGVALPRSIKAMMMRYDDYFAPCDQYPNRLDDWMEDYVSKHYNLSTFREFIWQMHTIQDALSPPLLREPKEIETKIKTEKVVVGDETVHPTESKTAPRSVVKPTKSSKRTKRSAKFAKGA